MREKGPKALNDIISNLLTYNITFYFTQGLISHLYKIIRLYTVNVTAFIKTRFLTVESGELRLSRGGGYLPYSLKSTSAFTENEK